VKGISEWFSRRKEPKEQNFVGFFVCVSRPHFCSVSFYQILKQLEVLPNQRFHPEGFTPVYKRRRVFFYCLREAGTEKIKPLGLLCCVCVFSS
jgi:hypothetical protein